MADVFISYASEDRERARKLANALEARGWSVWWDRKIVAGQTFDQIIEHELETAKSVVVLWSRSSISSEWVKNEAAAAAERSVLVPALIDTVKLPLEFRHKQTPNLIDWDGDTSQEGFQALCDGVATVITGVAPVESTTQPSRRLGWNRRSALGTILVIVTVLGLWHYLASPWLKEITTTSTNTLDYTSQMSPVRNQGAEASAVGFAVAAALEYQIQKAYGKKVIVSPRYIYYYARQKGGISTDKDSGTHIKDAMDVLIERGSVLEEEWPYKAGEFAAKSPQDIEGAEHYTISQAQPVRTVGELKSALKQFGPVVGGITYPQSISRRDVPKTGKIPLTGPGYPLAGYDAVCFVGFDDTKQLFKFQSHWGKEWGDNGYGYYSYESAEKFLSDAWAMSIKKFDD